MPRPAELEIMMGRLSIQGPNAILTARVQEIALTMYYNAPGAFFYSSSESTRDLTLYQQLERVLPKWSSTRIEDAVPEAERNRLRQLCEGWKADRGEASNSTPRKKSQSSTAAEVEEQRIAVYTPCYYAAFSNFFSDNHRILSHSDDEIPLFMAEMFLHVRQSALKQVDVETRFNTLGKEHFARGGFGRVYKGTDESVSPARVVAVKVISHNPEMCLHLQDHINAVKQEHAIMKKCSGLAVPEVYECVAERYFQAIVMEFVEGATLNDYFDDARLPDEKRLKDAMAILKSLAATLMTFQNLGLVHRDLKLENVMFCSKEINCTDLKTMDMGVSRERTLKSETSCGTEEFMAPELLKSGELGTPYKCNSSVDVYSLGCLILDGILGIQQYRELLNSGELKPQNIRASLNTIGAPTDLTSLLIGMVNKKPDKRPTPEDIFFHPSLAEYSDPFETVLESHAFIREMAQLRRSDQKTVLEEAARRERNLQRLLDESRAHVNDLEAQVVQVQAAGAGEGSVVGLANDANCAAETTVKRLAMLLAYTALRLRHNAHKDRKDSITLPSITLEIKNALDGVVTVQEITDYLSAGESRRLLPPVILTQAEIEAYEDGTGVFSRSDVYRFLKAVDLTTNPDRQKCCERLKDFHQVYW